MARPQDIINLIDVGLQTPAPDPTYGEVSPPNQETCARCHRPPADESDWCEGCRAFLLGDGEDPREEFTEVGQGWLVADGRAMARPVLMRREEFTEAHHRTYWSHCRCDHGESCLALDDQGHT